jgi:hypothetical protein
MKIIKVRVKSTEIAGSKIERVAAAKLLLILY